MKILSYKSIILHYLYFANTTMIVIKLVFNTTYNEKGQIFQGMKLAKKTSEDLKKAQRNLSVTLNHVVNSGVV